MQTVDREQAWRLLCEYNGSESLRAHALAVEAVMLHAANEWGEDGAYWRVVGLLHDIDYERYPDEHCKRAPEILREAGYDDDFIHAVVSHGWGLCADVEPEHRMEKALYALDELTGLITACVYMRPSKSVLDLELSSLKKKFKSKGFAAGVNRDVIRKGAELLDMPLDDVMALGIAGMKARAAEIGLAGTLG